jgi:hypothetical protein
VSGEQRPCMSWYTSRLRRAAGYLLARGPVVHNLAIPAPGPGIWIRDPGIDRVNNQKSPPKKPPVQEQDGRAQRE